MLLRIQNKAYVFNIILVICLIVFSVQSYTSLTQKSSTWDETHYFGLGKYLLKESTWDVPGSILHPPLSYYLHSLPQLFFPTNSKIWKDRAAEVWAEQKNKLRYLGTTDFIRGQLLLSEPANENDKLLILSRLMIVLVGLLLGYFVYQWCYTLYGKENALLSLILYTFSPNILAHTGLITPDMTITAFFFVATYFLWRALKLNSLKHTILCGVFLGFALLSKYTGLLLIPLILILTVIWKIKCKTLNVNHILIIFVIGFALLLLGYRGNIQPYFQGITVQLEFAKTSNNAFLWGNYSQTGWWYYFFAAFLIKTPIPTLILLGLSFYMLFDKNNKKRIDELFLLLPVIFIFGFFSIKYQNIGLRYVLPVFPFLFVFCGKIINLSYKKKIARIALLILMVWYIGSSLYVHPHYLAYFNELVGGPDKGYKYLVDSNIDWGQDLKELKKYMDENNIEKINLSYFGTDSPERYGIKYDWLPSVYLRNNEPQKQIALPLKGLIAISVTNLQGVHFEDNNLFSWLKNYEPIKKIGYSIYVYDIK